MALATALVAVGPVDGCEEVVVAMRPRQVLHEAQGGVYEATALSEAAFEVERTWRGADYAVLVSLDILKEQQVSFCSAQERVVAGQRYLVLIFCPAPDGVEEDGTAIFEAECKAEARAVSRSEKLLEALRRDTVVSRADLVHELRLWRAAPDLGDLHAWLVEADEYAQVDDWRTVSEEGDAYSLTGLAVEGLRGLVEEILDCDAESPRDLYLGHLRDTVLPVVIELLESPSTRVEQAETLEDFLFDFEVDC